jgi:uncharacterized protein (TIGR00369 family)
MSKPSQKFGLMPVKAASQISGLEIMRGILDGTYPAPPFAEVADVWPVLIEVGRITFEAKPSERFLNPMGLVHGGWTSLLLDTVMGCAVHTTLEAGKSYTTIDLRTTFVKPVRVSKGLVRCEGTLLHKGGQIASAEGRLYDEEGTLLAHGSETCLILKMS